MDSNSCDSLAAKLDEKIVDTNNPPGNYRIIGQKGIIGGALVDINLLGFNLGGTDYGYELTFKGKLKEGKLYYITRVAPPLQFEKGRFYKFDLSNVRTSGMLSGGFIDSNANKLTPLECK